MEDIRVLLVDDEEDIVYTMATILEMEKYTIFTAYNGYEALKVIDKQIETGRSIDILVTDIAMPKLSGAKLIEEIQKRELDIHILAITAFSTKNDLIELIQKGVEGYIEKPFRMAQLKNHIKIIAGKIQKVKFAQKKT
ncbi:MAG: response regulator [Chitinispirillia bacterium]|jgi:CheY-like chemotaxis protein